MPRTLSADSEVRNNRRIPVLLFGDLFAASAHPNL